MDEGTFFRKPLYAADKAMIFCFLFPFNLLINPAMPQSELMWHSRWRASSLGWFTQLPPMSCKIQRIIYTCGLCILVCHGQNIGHVPYLPILGIGHQSINICRELYTHDVWMSIINYGMGDHSPSTMSWYVMVTALPKAPPVQAAGLR